MAAGGAALAARLTPALQRLVDDSRLAGCHLVVSRGGGAVYDRRFGFMDLERRIPLSADAIYRLFSMTKQVTAVALMTLYERGLFRLDDPVHRFVPSWSDAQVWVQGEGADMVCEPARRAITFRDLLTHTSGLGYAVGWPGVPVIHPVDKIYRRLGVRVASSTVTMQAFLDLLARAPLLHHPGDRWTYSVASDACGALVEILSGAPFARFLKSEIFDPLGMRDTGFHLRDGDQARLSAIYAASADGALVPWPGDPSFCDYSPAATFSSGGGGLLSTTRDMVRFAEMLRGEGALGGRRILRAETVAMMATNQLAENKSIPELTTDPVFARRTGTGMGLGYYVTLDPQRPDAPGDFGGGGAASTFFWVDPAEDLSVVFMSQLIPADATALRVELRALIYDALDD